MVSKGNRRVSKGVDTATSTTHILDSYNFVNQQLIQELTQTPKLISYHMSKQQNKSSPSPNQLKPKSFLKMD